MANPAATGADEAIELHARVRSILLGAYIHGDSAERQKARRFAERLRQLITEMYP